MGGRSEILPLGQVKCLALGAGQITSHQGTSSLDPALMAISDTLPQGRAEILLGRSDILPWGQVSDPALIMLMAGLIPDTPLMSVQVKYLTPKHCL